MDQYFPLKCFAVYLRGMMPCLTNFSLDLLCCSFNWRTKKEKKDRQKKKKEETKVGRCRMNVESH